METYVKINGSLYPAEVVGRKSDAEWDGRESKTIKMKMEPSVASTIFLNNLSWSIVAKDTISVPVTDEYGNLVLVDGVPSVTTQETEQEYDNSEFCVAGSITDLRDGNIKIKMGKPTEKENKEKVSMNLIILAGKNVENESDVLKIREDFETAATKLSDSDALIAPSLTKSWDVNQEVKVGDRRYYVPNSWLYKCLKDHKTTIALTPDVSSEYWVRV